MRCCYFKDWPRRTASDKVLSNKAFIITINSQYDGRKHGLSSMVYSLLDEKSGGAILNKALSNQKQLANELHKLIIRKNRKCRVNSSYRDNIWVPTLPKCI